MKLFLYPLFFLFIACQSDLRETNSSPDTQKKEPPSNARKIKKTFAFYDNQPVFVDEYLYEKVTKNCLSLKVDIAGTTVPLLFVDWNNNNQYLDSNADYFGLEKNQVNKDQRPIIRLLKQSMTIEVNGKMYQLSFKSDKGSVKVDVVNERADTDTDLIFLNKMPDLTVPTLDNETVELRSLINKDQWVLLDFWATWCGPCVKKLEELAGSRERLEGKVTMVTLAYNCTGAEKFIQKTGIEDWINCKADDQAVRTFQITSVPRNFLFNKDGDLVAANISSQELFKIINKP